MRCFFVIVCLVEAPSTDAFEPRFQVFVDALANSSLLHQGDLVDAGTNDGDDAVRLAVAFAPRTVLAMDPLRSNVATVRAKAAAHWNLQVLQGGLSSTDGFDSYDSSIDIREGPSYLRQTGRYNQYLNGAKTRTNFTVYTIDTLFTGRSLAFAHFDVEGAEANVLRGAHSTIMRDQPLFTVEVFPTSHANWYAEVLGLIHSFDYEASAFNESCGWVSVPGRRKLRDKNCLNLICAPRRRISQDLQLSELLRAHTIPIAIPAPTHLRSHPRTDS